jgi:hypothetical protein
MPTVYFERNFVVAGSLLSYGANMLNQYRRAASYVDRILRGEQAAELPVQAPTKYELVINLKTAKALGIEVPPMLLALADEVIEIRRREFIRLIGGAAAAWPIATARAQPPAMPVVGFVNGGASEANGPSGIAFREGLNEAGFVDGRVSLAGRPV